MPSSTVFRLNWDVVDAGDLAHHPALVQELLDRTRDGVTITGIFGPEELEEVHRRLSEASAEAEPAVPSASEAAPITAAAGAISLENLFIVQSFHDSEVI